MQRRNYMGELEKNEFKETIKALTEEESIEAIKVMSSENLWQELIRRNTSMVQKINEIEDILGISVDNINPITVKAWEDIKTRYDDLEDKFKRIMKGFGK